MKTCFLILGAVLALAVGCGDDDGPDPGSDAGGGMDSGGGDVDSGGGDVDSGGGDVDSGGGDVDSGGGDTDAGGGDTDAGGDNDGGPAPGGPCSPGPCPPECFRAYECAMECGAPSVNCGCCPCAEGWVDTIGCTPDA